jgi:hypothetical protein
MTGWTRRRSSGEIINATLIEVFLALVFMVFCLAVFEQSRSRQSEAALQGALPRDDVERLRDSLRTTLDSLTVARGVASRRLDSLSTARAQLFVSPHPPDCEPLANPPWLVTVKLVGPGEFSVVAHRPVGGLTPKVAVRMTEEEFRARFADVRAAGLKQGCRFLAMVEDTPGTTKAGFKHAVAVIRSVFRDNGALR